MYLRLAIVVFFGSATSLLLLPRACAQGSNRGIAILPAEYRLGQVRHEDRILGVAEIVNANQKPLTIRSIRSNCACYKVSSRARELPPGESATVQFDLTFPRGKRLRNPVIYFLTDHKEKPMRTLLMKVSLAKCSDS